MLALSCTQCFLLCACAALGGGASSQYVAEPDCFTIKFLMLPTGKTLLSVTRAHTQVINFILLLHSRDWLSSDIADNFHHHLPPLPATWTLPGHDFIRHHCNIIRSQASICGKVPKVCCLWALHSQGVASTHSIARGEG